MRLDPPEIHIDFDRLASTSKEDDFHQLADEFLARVGILSFGIGQNLESTHEQGSTRMSVEDAARCGLVARLAKLIRALYEANQSTTTNSQHLLVRCIAETSINLRWLIANPDGEAHRAFRADSFVSVIKILRKQHPEAFLANEIREDSNLPAIRHLAHELRIAKLEMSQIPHQPNAWGGGSLRHRAATVGEGGAYDVMFGMNALHVHGSWHELRTFHIVEQDEKLHVDMSFGNLSPPVTFETCLLVCRALRDFVATVPPAVLAEDVPVLIERTGNGLLSIRKLSANFTLRGGYGEEWQYDPASDPANR